jgi:hypothetical protein
MENLEKKFLSHWKDTRAKGKLSFAIREALTKGFLFAIVIELGSATLFNEGTYAFDVKRNLLRLAIFVIGYFFYGLWLWRANENRYVKLTSPK